MSSFKRGQGKNRYLLQKTKGKTPSFNRGPGETRHLLTEDKLKNAVF